MTPCVQRLPSIGFFAQTGPVVWFTIAFTPLCYVFPSIDVSLRGVIPGAVIAAVGWASLEAMFRLYFSLAGLFQAYDLLGGVLLFVTWVVL